MAIYGINSLKNIHKRIFFLYRSFNALKTTQKRDWQLCNWPCKCLSHLFRTRNFKISKEIILLKSFQKKISINAVLGEMFYITHFKKISSSVPKKRKEPSEIWLTKTIRWDVCKANHKITSLHLITTLRIH